MAVTLQVVGVAKRFVNTLFEDVYLTVDKNRKIGLIGDNGSGKSTLLKMLAGRESVEEGTIVWSRGASIGYLDQTLTDGEMSGGEKKILNLTQLFYGGYDVLLLDEPDNHLDVEHKEWFEHMVQDFDGMIIVISHDRQFLETGVDTIWNLDELHIRQYDYSYTRFKEIYEGERAARQHLWEVQERERKRLEIMVKEFRVLAKISGKYVGRLHSAEKRLDKFVDEMVKKPEVEKKLVMKVDLADQHKKKTALQITDLKKSYGKQEVLKGVNLHAFCGDKIAISAPNGSGKSTLLNIMIGKLKANSGEVRIGDGLKIGYYAQEHLDALDENATMIAELQKSKAVAHYDAIGYLKRFKFTGSQITNEVRFLSGGQKSRLQLAKFLATNPDILVLDEPTNHLDLKTVLALENFLKDYEGTLILVSHDRELVENVVDRVYELKNGVLT